MATPSQLIAQPYNNATVQGAAGPYPSAAFAMPYAQANNIEVVYEYIVTPTGTSPTDSITLQGSFDNTDWVNIGAAVASLTTTAAPVAATALYLTVAYPLLRILHTLGGTTPVYAGMYMNIYAY